MTVVALMGAGGKMGCRITDNIKDNSAYQVRYVEVGEAGIARLAQRGITPTPVEQAVPDADIVVLAVPDVAIGKVSANVVPKMKPGAMVILLDPAAAYLGELVKRSDLSYFITHPCHPPIFNGEVTPEAMADHFGGIAAKQAVVCALMQGPDEDYAKGEKLACDMYAPVSRAHRITMEQMAMLEPSMAEVVSTTCVVTMKEAMEEVIRRGVPAEAARDFMLGHAQIQLAIVFGFLGSPFSDAAKIALEWAKPRILKPDWKQVFEPEQVAECIDVMLHPEKLGK